MKAECHCHGATMSSVKEGNLSVLYSELNKFGQNGEYERALKAANKCKLMCIDFSGT